MDQVRSESDIKARDALAGHINLLDMVVREFPEFPKLLRKVEGSLIQYASEKGVVVDKLRFGDVKWHNDGWVSCLVNASKLELVGVTSVYHQIVQAIFGIGHQLVGALKDKRSLRLVSFNSIGVSSDGMLKFRIRYANRPMAPRDIKSI